MSSLDLCVPVGIGTLGLGVLLLAAQEAEHDGAAGGLGGRQARQQIGAGGSA